MNYAVYFLLCLGLFLAAVTCQEEEVEQERYYAMCNIIPNPNVESRHGNNVYGSIAFKTTFTGVCSINVMKFNLTGFNTGDDITDHGITVHERGDMSGGCESLGDHYTAFGKQHGRPVDIFGYRHDGDLGNIIEEEGGVVTRMMADYATTVGKLFSIVGKGISIYQRNDNGHSDGGDAGDRIACCVVGTMDPFVYENWKRPAYQTTNF